MLTYSHRGYHETVPENTHEAFRQAVALGVHGTETDVRLTADGVAVLYHDRHSPDGAEVAAQTHRQLCQSAGFEVPSLSSALERWPSVEWMLEIKTPAALDATVDAAAAFVSTHRLIVTSFWHNVVESACRRLNVPGGLLMSHRPHASWLRTLSDGPQLPIDTLIWNYEVVDAEMVQLAQANGYRNVVFGAESPGEHRICAELGVDGIITDHPDLVPQALAA